MGNDARQCQEGEFSTSDGTSLFFRRWPSAQPSSQKVVVLFHRGHEHSGRLAHVVHELQMPDVHFYAWDARGHGRSPGERGYSPSMTRSVLDVDEFVQFVARDAGVSVQDIVVVGQSVGAVLVATWVHDYAPKIRAMVLASPAFKVKLYVPFARTGLAFWQRIKGLFYVNSYVKGKFLTHDRERVESFETDPLITRKIAVNILLELYSTAERVVADAQAITVPTQLLISGSDYVVHQKPQKQFYDRLRSPIKEQHILPGFFHDTLGEKDRHLAIEKMRTFIGDIFAQPAMAFDYGNDDKWSPSADTYRNLQVPLKTFCLRRLGYGVMNANMKTIGKLSKGMRLGYETGFDSGSTLDYVYKNEPQGWGFIGRAIDRQYLNSVGWQGIRQRKIHIEQLMEKAIAQLQQEGTPVRIVDIAAGHGRYVMDAVQKHANVEHVLLRDYSPINVEQGQKNLEARGLAHMARFENGNAFDRTQLSALSPQPTLAIVSGLYELFPDNALLAQSLAGLADAMPEGAVLIYTGQPWHPQLALIAHTLTNHQNGKSWVMRVRPQNEMDWLVEQAGFEKRQEVIDEFGIFTVSIAVRKARG